MFADEKVFRLSSKVKECAEEIVECIYGLDRFERVAKYFLNTGRYIKINTSNTNGLLPKGDMLSYMFVLPESVSYNPKESDTKRVFDKVYKLTVDGKELECKLSNQWKDSELEDGMTGSNFLQALVKIVNKCYSDVLEIKDKTEERCLILKNVDFGEKNTSSSDDIFSHNLYGIHIKEQNDALSEERPHICIGWSKLGDLSKISSKEELKDLYAEVWSDAKAGAKGQNVGQIWRFKNDVQIGDYIIFADGAFCHIARVESDYYYDDNDYDNQSSDYVNARNVVWLKKNILRSELSDAFQHSLGTAMSIWSMNDYRAAIADLLRGTYKRDDIDEEELTSESGVFSIADLPEAFDSKFARRYITSLMAKPFVILTGNSGTGKTRISKQFAEYLEVVDDEGEKNWIIVPVGADWTDNTKVMGFYNPLAESENEDGTTGRYEKTGILKLIERANDNPNIPYFLILDEMNLSHVERYFSDFLSHMETPDNPFKIDGYKNENPRDGQAEDTLDFPKNLFVVGTVNIDETTYMFSPKILDRANVVEFKPDKNDVLARFDSNEPEEKITPAGKGVAIDFLRIAMDIRDEVETLDAGDMEKVKDAFTEIYEICEKQGYEFAYRTVAEVKKYITAASELSEDWTEDELTSAIDEQLLQKVLPKIHGSRKEIGTMLGELATLCNKDNYRLPLSGEKIEQMIKRLDAVQYASFI